MLNIKKLLTKVLSNVVTLQFAVVQTGAISGNADANVSYASTFPGTPSAVIVNGWTPASSWDTTMSVQSIDTTAKTIRIRTHGSASQIYSLRCIAIYMGGGNA